MPPNGYEVMRVTPEQYLALLREQAAICPPGELKDSILNHIRRVQATLKEQAGPRADQRISPEAQATAEKTTTDLFARLGVRK